VKKYNEIVARMNSINADLNKENLELKALYENEKKLNAKSAKLANKYRTRFQLFKDVLYKKRDIVSKNVAIPDELYFFETMTEKASEMESDFKKDTATYRSQDNQVIVSALINKDVSVQLVVDTGASIVLISSDVAYRMGIKYDDIQTGIEITMADGSSAEAKPIILKSVKVGDAEVENVQAAILDKGIIGGADGLLGMSFLSNFVVSVDSAGHRLILERVL